MTKTLNDWNIELNYPVNLEEKIKSVKKVRLRLKKELLLYCFVVIAIIIMSICMERYILCILSMLPLISVIQNLRVWYDIYKIKKERYNNIDKE